MLDKLVPYTRIPGQEPTGALGLPSPQQARAPQQQQVKQARPPQPRRPAQQQRVSILSAHAALLAREDSQERAAEAEAEALEEVGVRGAREVVGVREGAWHRHRHAHMHTRAHTH